MLAIKWKNNSVKGILLVLVCAMLASTAMCNAYPMFREKAQANITEMQASRKTGRYDDISAGWWDEDLRNGICCPPSTI